MTLAYCPILLPETHAPVTATAAVRSRKEKRKPTAEATDCPPLALAVPDAEHNAAYPDCLARF